MIKSCLLEEKRAEIRGLIIMFGSHNFTGSIGLRYYIITVHGHSQAGQFLYEAGPRDLDQLMDHSILHVTMSAFMSSQISGLNSVISWTYVRCMLTSV